MDGSLGHFKATLARRKERQEKNHSRFEDGKNATATKGSKTKYNVPEISEKELEKVKLTYKVKRESQLIKEVIILGIVIIAGVVVAVWFM